ncbi:acyl CoA--acetate/3-ketoacid CoA transferase subunit alpha [Paraburkholderia sediminicola]|uniref:CoA transferase subunit A n=1 Tax=Paraburkholderia domus TaxID=2793075 RepID=UPI001B086BFA|nr:CoA transferase subunit A [Paraburkholderia domus]MCI0146915.1 acyl CoA--acetate/3-ketoacid CoA transferase subunit alpha [Paraburkholderia sediminicola]CAE6847477.1 Putative CoA-transferase subunit alpha [Paraburkholderia domus]
MKPLDKTLSARDAIAQLADGMMIGIGGWGPRRKPMALVREIVRSNLKDLTVVAYGGPDVGLLCAAGKVRKLVFGFVSLDVIPLEPHFRRAREQGTLDVWELDEGLLQLGLRAAAARLPFLPTRVGLGTDLLKHAPHLRTVQSPYGGETLLAMPALELDAALLHVNAADRMGNTRIDGPDPFFDAWFARAAKQCFVSSETLVDTLASDDLDLARRNTFERSLVSGVVHAPCGAHPTSCAPAYGWDLPQLKAYCASAEDPQQTAAYLSDVVGADEPGYLQRAGGRSHVAALPLPIL